MIPALEELKAVDQWVAYRFEVVDGRRTKVPYVGNNGHKADSTKPSTWRPFSVAASAYQKAGHEGMGFVVSPNDPYTGIDLDHCRDAETGVIEEWAQRIVDRFDSYTEITPSREGLRIWIKGSVPADHHRKGHIEIYDRGRYFTVTGKHLEGTPTEIHGRQDQLDAIYAELWPEPVAPRASSAPSTLNDAEILDRARRARNGATVAALLAGDTAGYDSGSEADLALIGLLAFYTQDRGQLDRLYRGSGLYREKWERAGYREGTITKALSTIVETYGGSAGRIRHTGGHSSGQSNGVDHRDTDHHDEDSGDVGESHPLTDLRNGERFVSRHGLNVRYCRPWRRWLTWSGHRWEEDGDVEALAKETARAIWDEAKAADSKELSSWAIRSQSSASIAGMLTMARSEPVVTLTVKDLDTDPWLLNTPSGTIDLRTGALFPSRREDLITKITAAKVDLDAACPRWERFLEEVFTKADLTPDRDLIEYIRRLVGYSLTGSVREQMIAILYGTGRNGKGVFTNTLRYMLGDYGWVTPAELLLSKRSDNHPTGLAALWGRRVVISAETDQGRRLDESLIKNLTGGDPIPARRMREDYWEFPPEFKLMLATNYKPEIRGTDTGIWSRIHCIPFLRTFDPERDEHLETTLRGEWPGILAWAVRGCLAWQDGGLRPPAAVVEATRTYRMEQDAIQRFLEECCDTSVRLEFVAAAKLYNAYKAWCDNFGEHQVTATVFGAELTTRGFTKDHQRVATIPTVIRRHIRLKDGG